MVFRPPATKGREEESSFSFVLSTAILSSQVGQLMWNFLLKLTSPEENGKHLQEMIGDELVKSSCSQVASVTTSTGQSYCTWVQKESWPIG
ncbi:hypothetical protein EYF80_040826 [Liparis tanakae]|uniref:Uncharacterized protein n=1 Tax=Liparis tanakae TaxID=230148 RepID=A0A4Z2G658_9TELE|nr:hypothetical protein EYF80_040826 [Liparis tanakae]